MIRWPPAPRVWGVALALCAAPGLAGLAQAQDDAAQVPLSAIDWLSDSVRRPAAPAPPEDPDAGPRPGLGFAPVTQAPLDGPRRDAAGLLSARAAGLPVDLWAGSDPDALARRIASQPVDALPAGLSLLHRLLLAALDPPGDAGTDRVLLLARVDKLLELGALETAQALLEQAGPNRPELFRRWFDVSLLTGQEARACAAMRATPDIAPKLAARVYCLARTGDWDTAVLTLETGAALGHIPPEEEALLARFLDPALAEELPEPTPPVPMTPLVFRMFEAIGLAQPTGMLPLAFAHADLAPRAGWKAQLEAAERLARSGALSAYALFELYTARRPAASGGVWDRVAAVQALDVALLAGDAREAATVLARTRAALAAADLEVPFSVVYADRLQPLAAEAGGPAPMLAFRAALLGERLPPPEAAPPGDATARWLALLARPGAPLPDPPPEAGALARTVREGLTGAPPADGGLGRLLAAGRRGEALLMALERLATGAAGDPREMRRALAALVALGLEPEARRIGLELLLLDRRG